MSAAENSRAAAAELTSDVSNANDSTTLISSEPTSQAGSGMNESPDESPRPTQENPPPQNMQEGGDDASTMMKEKEEEQEPPSVVPLDGETGANGQQQDVVAQEDGEIGPQPLSVDSANGDADMMVLDDAPSSSSDTPDMGEDFLEWFADSERESKRVKVYELVGSIWQDQGTAFCTGIVKDDSADAYLVARSERDLNQIVLTTQIKSTEVYQRQQSTLIVWTEPDGVDYALSFQDPDGCSEVWNFITEVQKHMNADMMVSSPVLDSLEDFSSEKFSVASFIRSGQLPSPALGMIDQIELVVRHMGRTPALKEKVSEYILTEDYVRQLISVFIIAEDLEDIDNLHAICGLMQTILMLNDHNLYDHLLEDEMFSGVLGMLEYDPEFPTHKGNFREFIRTAVHFHQPIDIKDPLINRKIHQTYRLQFLKDVVLARTLDDSTFNVLNSCIIFNQIDIIAHVQNEPSFLKQVVCLFATEAVFAAMSEVQAPGNPLLKIPNGAPPSRPSNDGPVEEVSSSNVSPNNNLVAPSSDSPINGQLSPEDVLRRKEVVLLVQQLCIMGKNIQLPSRLQLFRTLVERGILFVVQWAVGLRPDEAHDPASHSNMNIISAGGEILSTVLDHDLLGARQFLLKQLAVNEKGNVKSPFGSESVLLMLCRILTQCKDLSVQSLVGDCLKTWLEMASDGLAGNGGEAAGRLQTGGKKDEPSNERFLDYFYKICVGILMKPLNDLPEWKDAHNSSMSRLPREMANRYLYLCDILHSMLSQHHFRSYLYVMSSNIMVRIASLLQARDKHLRHAAFRFFRLLLRMNNITLRNQMIKHDVLQPILNLTLRESKRDNLVSCSCHEFFETIRRDNIKDLIAFCMTQHRDKIDQLATSPLGAERFTMFIRRHEINIEPPPKVDPASEESSDRRLSVRGSLDKAEEDYFLGDDNEDDYVVPISQQPVSGISSPNGIKRKRGMQSPIPGSGFQRKPIAPVRSPLESLSDYSDDDDDESRGKPVFPDIQRGAAGPSDMVRHLKDQIQQKFSNGWHPSPSASPTISASSIPPLQSPPRRLPPDEDDEDNMLENLVRVKPRAASPSPPSGLGRISAMSRPPRSGEKRRRDDDGDDEAMERLSKRVAVGVEKNGSSSLPSKTKQGDDPPKKIQMKIGALGKAVASAFSDTNTKDGDTG